MALKVADSDVLIDYLKLHWPERVAISDGLARGELVTTTVTKFEVLPGARTPPAMLDALQLFSQMESLPLDDRAAETAARIDRELRAIGKGIEAQDILIAGIAITNGLPVLTRNVRHFQRIPGLAVETI